MRQKRSKKKGNNNGALLKYIVLLIAGGTIAVSFGYYIAKGLILPRFRDTSSNQIVIEKPKDDGDEISINKPEPKPAVPTQPSTLKPNSNTSTPTTNKPAEESNTGKYTISLPPIEIYNVQVGSFNSEVHANTLVAELHKKNLGGFAIATDRYRVSTLAVGTRAAANAYKEVIKDSYSDAFIAKVSVPERQIKYSEGNEQLNKGINTAVVEVNNYLKRLSNFVENKLNNASKAEVDKYIDTELVFLQSVKGGLDIVNPSDQKLVKLHKNVQGLIDTSITKLTQAKSKSTKDVATIHDALLIGMNGYALANN